MRFKTVLYDTMVFSPDQLRLFHSIFRGRDDVFARYWHSARTGKSGYAPAKFHTGEYASLTDEIILSHLQGDALIGIYPLQKDNTTHVLAVDFDGDKWLPEAKLLLAVTEKHGIPHALERSKSGNGGHVWFLFETAIPAWKARQWGKYLLTEAGITKQSTFDRLFPSQDEHAGKGLGNLIALPLSGAHVSAGNSSFIDVNGKVFSDPWQYLASLKRISDFAVDQLIAGIPRSEGEEGDPTTEKVFDCVPTNDQPRAILILENEIFIPSHALPDRLFKFLRRKLVFRNPEHLINERRGYSNWKTPRWIYALRRYEDGVVVPAGLLEEIKEWSEENGISLSIEDRRYSVKAVKILTKINLRPDQERALKKLLQHDRCVLEALPGFGKTVVALQYIAKRRQPALIIVHTKELLQQWQKRIQEYCILKKGDIGIIGDNKWKIGKLITIASQRTLVRRDLSEIKNVFGSVIIDECHHIPASTFISVVRQFDAPYFLGLTATPYRKDKLERLMVYVVGPVVKTKDEGLETTIESRPTVPVTVHLRGTALQIPEPGLDFFQITEKLMRNVERNAQIASDIVALLEAGHKCLVLSDRVEHCHTLFQIIRQRTKGIHGAVAEGTMTKGNRMRLSQRIRQDRFQLLIATGKLIGEGFDWPEVGHLFFAFPFSWKGNLVQYVGRVQRVAPHKTDAHVYDYVDFNVPMLKRMYFNRQRRYRMSLFALKHDRLRGGSKDVSEAQISMF